jgi:hypothetical protein
MNPSYVMYCLGNMPQHPQQMLLIEMGH